MNVLPSIPGISHSQPLSLQDLQAEIASTSENNKKIIHMYKWVHPFVYSLGRAGGMARFLLLLGLEVRTSSSCPHVPFSAKKKKLTWRGLMFDLHGKIGLAVSRLKLERICHWFLLLLLYERRWRGGEN